MSPARKRAIKHLTTLINNGAMLTTFGDGGCACYIDLNSSYYYRVVGDTLMRAYLGRPWEIVTLSLSQTRAPNAGHLTAEHVRWPTPTTTVTSAYYNFR